MKYLEVHFSIQTAPECWQDAADLLADMAADAGFETFESESQLLKGYVQETLFDQTVLDGIICDFPMEEVVITYQVQQAEYKNWNEQWEQEGFDPIVIDNRCVIHDGRHLPAVLPEQAAVVEIDAHLAFGTGNHETTRMMVDQLLQLDLHGKRVLDCGCGTGILALMAIRLGASEAVAYDIDEWSSDNALHNAVINGLDSKMKVMLGDASLLLPLADLPDAEKFDVVMANINRNILLNDMEAFVGVMKPDATLLMSGFIDSDVDLLNGKARMLGLKAGRKCVDNHWTSLAFHKDAEQ